MLVDTNDWSDMVQQDRQIDRLEITIIAIG